VGKDSQRARELLRNGQLPADAGTGTRLAHEVTVLRETDPVTVLVIGSTGELGGEVVRALGSRGIDVRAMTRRSDGPRPSGAVQADLRDPSTLGPAFVGVERVFLVSSPTPDQVAVETNAIVAAERAGVGHIVKVSNLPIAGLDSGLHGNHRAIERRLSESRVASTVLQPSFFASVVLRQLALLERGRLVLPTGEGQIAWIDPRDIADVAATVLADPSPPPGPLRLTGPEALTAAELAARIEANTGHRIALLQPALAKWRADLLATGMDPWLAESTVDLYEAVASGALGAVSPDVERALGRPPRAIDEWLRDVLAPRLLRSE
jgi:(4-alkanoyl-5-oxo-2,5-dihydrofuran-3-yl)methyl phosphate reductase